MSITVLSAAVKLFASLVSAVCSRSRSVNSVSVLLSGDCLLSETAGLPFSESELFDDLLLFSVLSFVSAAVVSVSAGVSETADSSVTVVSSGSAVSESEMLLLPFSEEFSGIRFVPQPFTDTAIAAIRNDEIIYFLFIMILPFTGCDAFVSVILLYRSIMKRKWDESEIFILKCEILTDGL